MLWVWLGDLRYGLKGFQDEGNDFSEVLSFSVERLVRARWVGLGVNLGGKTSPA